MTSNKLEKLLHLVGWLIWKVSTSVTRVWWLKCIHICLKSRETQSHLGDLCI